MGLLPENMEQAVIKLMSVYDEGYTVPWAISVDLDRQMWINGNYPVYDAPRGTVTMRIQRIPNGVRVWADSIGEHKYTPTAGGWHTMLDAIPVIEFILPTNSAAQGNE